MENYLLERKLRDEDKNLHRRAAESVFVLQTMLSKYLTRFPDFTDHSFLHSMNVIDYCNRIIGDDQIKKLCPEECYVLIMGCYLHDIGMGIGSHDFAEFSQKLDFGDYFDNHDREDEAATVRAFHNEYSGLFIRKYSKLFDIPSDAMTRAIIQVSRGHRKTDLLDRSEFGNIQAGDAIIRTAYLSAVMRLADEIDVASDRNPILLFGNKTVTDEISIIEFGLHKSILYVDVGDDTVTLHTRPITAAYRPKIEMLAEKITDTLNYCRTVAEQTSDLRIRQKRVIIQE
ncbi:MAG: hypothetical protein IJJ06_12280 [Mogibacterium sp.]|nr:hypothetical protein [Mogibacterium sp.]MBR0341755.1 hypothetical protein [Oscillospiraceae bacterium]